MKVRFQKAGFEVEVVPLGVDKYGKLRLEGTIAGLPFRGEYEEIPGRRVIRFYTKKLLGGREVAGVEPPPEVKAVLDQIRERGLREREMAAQAYVGAVPPALRLALEDESGHIYVYPFGVDRPDNLPLGTENRIARVLEERIARLGAERYALLRLGELARVGRGRIVPLERLLEALGLSLEELLKEEETGKGTDPDPRPLVMLRRCWECGRVEVARLPEGVDRGEVEAWIRQGHQRALERAKGPLASVGFEPDPAPWRVVVHSYYCGCGGDANPTEPVAPPWHSEAEGGNP